MGGIELLPRRHCRARGRDRPRALEESLRNAQERQAFRGKPIGAPPGDPAQARRSRHEDRGVGLLMLQAARKQGRGSVHLEAGMASCSRPSPPRGRARGDADPRRLRLPAGARGRADLPRRAGADPREGSNRSSSSWFARRLLEPHGALTLSRLPDRALRPPADETRRRWTSSPSRAGRDPGAVRALPGLPGRDNGGRRSPTGTPGQLAGRAMREIRLARGADPQEYGVPAGARGGVVILEEVNVRGGRRGRLPCPDVRRWRTILGTKLRRRSPLSAGSPPASCEPPGVRRHRAVRPVGHHPDQTTASGRSGLPRPGPEDLDVASSGSECLLTAAPLRRSRADARACRRSWST